jgi:high-affinity nickel permease
MIIGSKVMKIAIFRDKIQDGRHKNPMGHFFSMGTSKIVFLTHFGVQKSRCH